VAASLAFETVWPADGRGLFPLLAGLAARESAGEEIELKWPNDLLVGGRKVGGILVEADGDLVIAGLGVNLWWPEPIAGAGALLSADPGPEAPDWLAEQWAAGFLERVAAGPGAWDPAEYARHCATLGSELAWEPDGSGTAVGIGEDGSLLVDTGEATVALHSGEVSLIRRGG
jgi:BirA family biotin operon repressor/biotin-[acetyl-CoA-carboxylase] ligase